MRAAPLKCAKSPGSMVAKNCSCASISACCKWKSPDDPMAGVRTIANRSWSTIAKRATRAEQKGEAYELTPEQCAELQQEGIQYYHRYLSLFQINDFEGVVRDTQRNLDLFSFVNEHTDREDFSWGMQQFRPYVLMMNTRAKASIFLAQGKFADAIAEIERGREAIVDFLQQSNFPELVSKSAEIAFLDEWLEEVKSKRPLSKLEVMQREMETAIAKELYERAAELRDAIKLLKTQRQA